MDWIFFPAFLPWKRPSFTSLYRTRLLLGSRPLARTIWREICGFRGFAGAGLGDNGREQENWRRDGRMTWNATVAWKKVRRSRASMPWSILACRVHATSSRTTRPSARCAAIGRRASGGSHGYASLDDAVREGARLKARRQGVGAGATARRVILAQPPGSRPLEGRGYNTPWALHIDSLAPRSTVMQKPAVTKSNRIHAWFDPQYYGGIPRQLPVGVTAARGCIWRLQSA